MSARDVVKLAFHDADTDILADILARIVARMSACRSACQNNYFVSDVSARILARKSVSVSWNASLNSVNHGRVELYVLKTTL